MFTYIYAKNFKSLKEIYFNLNKTQNTTNKFLTIYGENGSGKTNIVEIFDFLQRSCLSKTTEFSINKIPKEYFETKNENFTSMINKAFSRFIFNYNKYRMINEPEPTEIKYGFKINGVEGYYYIKFIEEILEEKLYYKVDKQKGIFFEIVKKENEIVKYLNSNIFFNKKYSEELLENLDKFWGRYSFLSLLCLEITEKNKEYITKNISINLYNIIEKILSLEIQVKNEDSEFKLNSSQVSMSQLEKVQEGIIGIYKKDVLLKYEKMLKKFFIQAYADIKDVKYILEEKNGSIFYKLYFEKIIGGQLKEIYWKSESSGTINIIDLFNSFIKALKGGVVIIDEIDNGIHDLLIKNILMSISEEITGQLIITTHNTLLLETLPKEKIYILSTDVHGNKKINSIREYDIKVQKNNNIRELYFKGVFGGIPLTSAINFKEIKQSFEEDEESEE